MNDVRATPPPARPYDALMELRGPFAAQGPGLYLLWADERWEVARITAPAITPAERATLAGRLARALNDGAAAAAPLAPAPAAADLAAAGDGPDPDLLR